MTGRWRVETSVRGTAAVDIVEGIPPEYLEAAHKVVEPDQWDEWEAGVRKLYKSMARIVVTPEWAKVLDFETRLPDPVRRLAAEQGGLECEHVARAART